MELIKRYKIIIAVLLPVLILIFIRSCTPGKFKTDARKWSEPSFKQSNIITPLQAATISGEKLIVNLDNEQGISLEDKTAKEIHIPPDSVVSEKYLNIIRHHRGPVLLASSDQALSARIWMIISQTGNSNIYILTGNSDNETFKNKFRSDTLAGPEL
jgi:hypothetical protein